MKKNINKLVVASHNKGKVREINALLENFGVKAQSAGELGLEEPEETETTFIGNALLKARAAAIASGEVALADDSGLCVNALGGDPGIYSARWAGENKDFYFAMSRIEKELKDKATKDYSAYFVCALALVWPDGEEMVFEGRVNGNLVFPPKGQNGFGYDPIFVADGENITFGEMDPDKKHAMSHRAKAFEKLVAEVFA